MKCFNELKMFANSRSSASEFKKKCLKQNTISAILGEFLIERAPAFSSSSKANATHIQLTGRELLFSGFLLRISLFHVNFSGGCFHSRTKGPSMYLVLPFIVIDSVQPKPLVWFRSDTVIDTKTTF